MSIPNTLTIFINTNVRGSTKIIYKPNMTVPGETDKDDHVNFDPLIRLNRRIIYDIPPNEPKNELYTQFFRRNLFKSLVARTIARTYQPKGMTLYKATKQGIIDNNIRQTLNTLFAKNTKIHLKGKTYLVDSYNWNTGDWRIDTKRLQAKFFGVPFFNTMQYFYINKANYEIAQHELDDIPKQIRQGRILNGVTSKFKEEGFELTKDVIGSPDAQQTKLIEDKLSTQEANIYNNTEMKDNLPANLKNTFDNLVDVNTFTNNTSVIDFALDPIIRSTVFFDDREFNKVRNGNDRLNKKLNVKYIDFDNSYINYQEKLTQYKELLGLTVPIEELQQKSRLQVGDNVEVHVTNTGSYIPATIMKINIDGTFNVKFYDGSIEDNIKENDIHLIASVGIDDKTRVFLKNKMYNELTGKFYIYINEIKKDNTLDQLMSDDVKKEKIFNIVNDLNKFKKGYAQDILKAIAALYQSFIAEREMFKNLLSFLEYFKKTYQNDVNQRFKMYNWKLHLFILDFDIKYYKALLDDPVYNEFIDDIMVNNIKEITQNLEPIIKRDYDSMVEIEKYYNFPELLLIERFYFDVNNYELLKYENYNKKNIWTIFNDQTETFYTFIKDMTTKQLETTKFAYDNFQNRHTDQEKETIFNAVNVMKKQGTTGSNGILSYVLSSSNKLKGDINTVTYIENNIITSYDFIFFYLELGLIKYSRQGYYISIQENAVYINSMISHYLSQYYFDIINVLKNPYLANVNVDEFFKNPFFNFLTKDDIKIDVLNYRIDFYKNSIIEDDEKFKKFNEELIQINKNIDDLDTILFPTISKFNIYNTCNKLLGNVVDTSGNVISSALPTNVTNLNVIQASSSPLHTNTTTTSIQPTAPPIVSVNKPSPPPPPQQQKKPTINAPAQSNGPLSIPSNNQAQTNVNITSVPVVNPLQQPQSQTQIPTQIQPIQNVSIKPTGGPGTNVPLSVPSNNQAQTNVNVTSVPVVNPLQQPQSQIQTQTQPIQNVPIKPTGGPGTNVPLSVPSNNQAQTNVNVTGIPVLSPLQQQQLKEIKEQEEREKEELKKAMEELKEKQRILKEEQDKRDAELAEQQRILKEEQDRKEAELAEQKRLLDEKYQANIRELEAKLILRQEESERRALEEKERKLKEKQEAELKAFMEKEQKEKEEAEKQIQLLLDQQKVEDEEHEKQMLELLEQEQRIRDEKEAEIKALLEQERQLKEQEEKQRQLAIAAVNMEQQTLEQARNQALLDQETRTRERTARLLNTSRRSISPEQTYKGMSSTAQGPDKTRKKSLFQDATKMNTNKKQQYIDKILSQRNTNATKELKINFDMIQQFGEKSNILDEMDLTTFTQFNNWVVLLNEGGGDCFFSCIRDAFNGNNVYNSSNFTPKVRSSDSKYADHNGFFSVQGIRKAVADNFTDDDYVNYSIATEQVLDLPLDSPDRTKFNFMINENNQVKTIEEVRETIGKSCSASNNPNGPLGNYWGDEFTITKIEEIFKIKLIIFDAREKNYVKKNSFITFNSFKDNKQKYGLVSDYNNSTNKVLKIDDLDSLQENNTSQLNNLLYKGLQIKPTQKLYPTLCSGSGVSEGFLDYVFILLTGGKGYSEHYELIANYHFDTSNKSKNNYADFIFDYEKIPSYITYSIFLSCYKNISIDDKKDSSLLYLPGIGEDMIDMDEKITQVSKIPTFKGGAEANMLYAKYGELGSDTRQTSRLSYYVIIDLSIIEKGPWDKIPLTAQIKLKCNNCRERIRKAWADLFNKKYEPLEFNLNQRYYKNDKKNDDDANKNKTGSFMKDAMGYKT